MRFALTNRLPGITTRTGLLWLVVAQLLVVGVPHVHGGFVSADATFATHAPTTEGHSDAAHETSECPVCRTHFGDDGVVGAAQTYRAPSVASAPLARSAPSGRASCADRSASPRAPPATA